MRNTLLLICLMCLCLYNQAVLPNDESKGADAKRWRRGYVVTPQGDTLEGKIKVPDFLDVYYDYQRSVSFKNAKGTVEYTPTELNSFSYYEEKDSLITLQSVTSPEGDGHVFLKIYYTGDCKVYGFMQTELRGASGNIGTSDSPMRSSLIPNEKKYIQIKGSQFYQMRRIGFKRSMMEVFAACPHIVANLELKVYTYDNWPSMIHEYNCGCK